MARYSVDAKRAQIPQAGAWSDPTISVSYGGNAVPPFTLMRADPSSIRQVMVEQMIPYPGKTHLRTQMAARDADAESLGYAAAVRRIAAEVKQAYFDLAFVDCSLEVLQRDRGVLQQFEKVTEIRYSTGKAMQQDVLRAQLEVTKLAQREAMLTQQRRTLAAQLNSLRNFRWRLRWVRRPGHPKRLHPERKPIARGRRNQTTPDSSSARSSSIRASCAIDLARKEERPDFSVGYTYMQRDALPDMYGITLSTSLPIFRRRKQDKAVAEAAANLESARQMQASEANVVRYQVQQDLYEVEATEQLLKLYTQGVAPQSRLTLESSLAGYQTGGVDFLSVISNFQAVIDAELDYQQQITRHEKALARLEETTGLNLIQQGEAHHE